MKLRILTIFLITCLSFSAFAGRLEKAFEELAKGNLFNAYEFFHKEKQDRPAGSSFGLAKMFVQEKSKYYNLDSAYYYIVNCELFYKKEDSNEKLKLNALNINNASIKSLKSLIDAKAYEEVKLRNTFILYQKYITLHTSSEFLKDAIKNRNALAYSMAKTKNTPKAFQEFYTTYPDAVETEEAKKEYERLLFLQQIGKRTESSYVEFIKAYPLSPYKNNAEDSLYLIFRSVNTIASYETFVSKYPTNRNIKTAWRKLYHMHVAVYDPNRMEQFLLKYPQYPMRDSVLKELKNNLTELILIRENNVWGFMDLSGATIIPCRYRQAENFKEGLAEIQVNNKYGYVNKSGEIVIEPDYESTESFENGVAVVSKDDKYGLINRFGETVIPFRYQGISSLQDGLRLIQQDSMYSFMTESGKIISPFIFDDADDFSEGLALVGKNGKYGFIDKEGKIIVPPLYDWAEAFKNGCARASKDGDFCLLVKSHIDSASCGFSRIDPMTENLFLVVADSKLGFADSSGTLKITPQYEYVSSLWGGFRNGQMKYFSKGKYGLVNNSGKVIVNATYDDISFYSQGLCAFKKSGKWGYLDTLKKMTISNTFTFADCFYGGLAKVKKSVTGKGEKKDRFGFIDKKGKTIIPCIYEEADNFKDSICLVKLNGFYGLIDNTGKKILNTEFDKIEIQGSPFYKVFRNSRFAYISKENLRTIWKEDGF